MKVSPAFSKAAGCRGRAPARAPQSAELSFMLIKDQEGGLRGKPYQGVSPFYFTLLRVRRFLGRGSLPPAAFSTPFLWCLPKETVSSRQRKALFYPGGSTGRVSAASRWTTRSSPDLGRGWCGLFAFTFPDARPKLRWTRPTGGCSRRSRRRCPAPRRRRRGRGTRRLSQGPGVELGGAYPARGDLGVGKALRAAHGQLEPLGTAAATVRSSRVRERRERARRLRRPRILPASGPAGCGTLPVSSSEAGSSGAVFAPVLQVREHLLRSVVAQEVHLELHRRVARLRRPRGKRRRPPDRRRPSP